MMIPYWTYGLDLKNLASNFISQFCTTRGGNRDATMEQLHNIAHNNQGCIVNDNAYSIVNPVFFAYHGFIDLVLQFRIN